MLQLSGSFLGKPVLSLRSGGAIANVIGAVINPNNLKIEGLYCEDFDHRDVILLYQDIRDIITQGVIVNDFEVLAEPSELIRLKDIMEMNFELLGKPVYTVSKAKVGKVNDFAFDTSSMYIQKIYVAQSLLKSLSGGNLGIDRNQIVEITHHKIIVNDLQKRVPARANAVAQA